MEPGYPQPERHRIPVLKILATILLVLVLICGGLVTFVAYNFRAWVAAGLRGPLVASVDQTALSDAQKVSIKQNLSRVADEYQSGRISFTQASTIIQKLSDGPFFNLITVEAMKHQFGTAHSQPDAERHETMLFFDRFARGIVEGTVPRQQVSDVLALAHDPDEPHPNGASNQVTEAELKPFIDAMKKAVEAAQIPAEPFEPDYAAEIDKAVTAVLGPAGSSTTPAPASTAPATRAS